MAITTTPTAGMKLAISNEFKVQFPTNWVPPSNPTDLNNAVATKFGEIIAIAIQQALIEVKNNADLVGVSSGGDTVAGGVN